MAIDTTAEKFSVLIFARTTDPANLPVSTGAIGQDEKQQFLWGYAGTLWGAAVAAIAGVFGWSGWSGSNTMNMEDDDL